MFRGSRAPQRRSIESLSILVALLVFHRSPSARAEAPRPRSVGLDEVLAATARAPEHLAARAHARAAEKAEESAGGLPPTLLSVGTSRLQARLIAAAELPLPLFGRLGAERDVAHAERARARADAAEVDLGLRHDVRLTFYELARDQARAELSATSATRAERLAQVAHRRFEAGDAAQKDTAQADAAALRARTEATSEQARVEASSAALASLLGWDPMAPLRARGGLPTAFPDVPPVGALAARLGSHPGMLAADAQMTAADARVVAASRARWPLLSLGTEAEVFDPGLPGPDVRVTLNLEVPLFGRRSAAREAAAAEHAAVQADRASLASRALGTLVAAYLRYRAAGAQARGFSQNVVPAAREADRLAEVAYDRGEADLISVLDAERSLADVEREWLEARLTAAAALAELLRAAGGAL